MEGYRDPIRIPEVLAALERLWSANPDLRLGQIIGNAAGLLKTDPYFMEDDKLLEALKGKHDRS